MLRLFLLVRSSKFRKAVVFPSSGRDIEPTLFEVSDRPHLCRRWLKFDTPTKAPTELFSTYVRTSEQIFRRKPKTKIC